jgi:transposase
MTDTNSRQKFTKEFKKEAVSLVTEQGYSLAQAAEAIGVREDYIRRWQRDIEKQTKPSALSAPERDELLRLRRENKQLKMEKEILKKASAFFAREMS